jgi:hypothetical protein
MDPHNRRLKWLMVPLPRTGIRRRMSVAQTLHDVLQHLHGQTLRVTRAEIGLTGVRSRTGKGSKTAPTGAVAFSAPQKHKAPQMRGLVLG